ncbi:MAG: phosphomannomutase/phosphoglucomutase [Syntrophaceae bacterium]
MNTQVFREYDIRGVVEDDLNEEFVTGLAQAVSAYWADHGVKRVCLGMDARLSSPLFKAILSDGITACGIDVVDIGLAPTPAMYYALFRLGLDGGIAITGSHNPPDNNGFKVALGKTTIHGAEIQKIRAYMERGIRKRGAGKARSHDIIPEYVDDILARIHRPLRSLKVVIDPGNGVGGAPAMAVCQGLGMDASGICLEPDGRFPNHHPDPTISEGVAMLTSEVIRTKADIGIGLDGDADRLGVVDAKGRVVYGDMITAILARAILKERPGEKIIGEVKCSKALFEEIKHAGGIPIMGKVGHSLMKARLMEEQAALAGEMSGHIFFADRWYGFDDGIYAAARLLEVLAAADDPQAVFDRLPRMENTPEIRLACPDEIKFAVVDRFKDFASEHYQNCIDIDGVRFEDGEAWGLVRPSNTQPVIVLRFEAADAEKLANIQSAVTDKLFEIMQTLR